MTAKQPQVRLIYADVARGLALLAMAIYHLSWDLFWFDVVDWDVSGALEWRWFARLIAGSFLFLVGFSLVLGHRKGVRWHRFWKREAKVVAAALLISVATYFVFPDQWVRFGILHFIAVASVLALPFALHRASVALLCAGLVFFLGYVLGDIQGLHWAFLWLGLNSFQSVAVDYVPLIPWFGVVLGGVALGIFMMDRGITEVLRGPERPCVALRCFAFFGRHSLATYLLHQPLLYGVVWALVLVGVFADPSIKNFQQSCVASCRPFAEEAVCVQTCHCTVERLVETERWAVVNAAPSAQSSRDETRAVFQACYRQQVKQP